MALNHSKLVLLSSIAGLVASTACAAKTTSETVAGGASNANGTGGLTSDQTSALACGQGVGLHDSVPAVGQTVTRSGSQPSYRS